jgi:hypothetical protein
MSLIRPPLAANTITAKSPSVFVQEEVLDGVSDRVPEQVLEGVPIKCWKQKRGAFFPCNTKKCELDLGNHKT